MPRAPIDDAVDLTKARRGNEQRGIVRVCVFEDVELVDDDRRGRRDAIGIRGQARTGRHGIAGLSAAIDFSCGKGGREKISRVYIVFPNDHGDGRLTKGSRVQFDDDVGLRLPGIRDGHAPWGGCGVVEKVELVEIDGPEFASDVGGLIGGEIACRRALAIRTGSAAEHVAYFHGFAVLRSVGGTLANFISDALQRIGNAHGAAFVGHACIRTDLGWPWRAIGFARREDLVDALAAFAGIAARRAGRGSAIGRSRAGKGHHWKGKQEKEQGAHGFGGGDVGVVPEA